ncbi:MAG: proline dehydrogenase family protein [Saprospiraceae bacterium]
MNDPEPIPNLDFGNTEVAFAFKTDKELKKTKWLFNLMNNNNLVKLFSTLGLWAIKLHVPFTKTIIRNTIFEQFIGGETLLDSQKTIDKLYEYDILTILDYGAEGKSTEDDHNAVLAETLRAIEWAASNNTVPIVSTKLTGLVDNIVLEKLQKKETLNDGEKRNYAMLEERVNTICEKAFELNVGVFIDAEESWIQDPIDSLAMEMMTKYNKDRVTVYNTYQMYNINKLSHLKRDHKICTENGVLFGAKLVRGAYMDKERERAKNMGYIDPIQPNKIATDTAFNEGIKYCIDNYTSIAVCCASHNAQSNLLLTKLMHEHRLTKDHPHSLFCQLYGMSDTITFNLANAGYNAAKYVVYGPIKDVIPYLIRRTEENTSVTGEMGRELEFLHKEMKRRAIV